MNKHIKNQSQDASITVFFSLLLILILSLVMTVIEGARQSTARVFAERAFTSSMDSVLAGFYGPLMEEYHLLGLDSSYGGDAQEYGEMAQIMQDYMSYTLNPSRGLYGADKRLNYNTSLLESVVVTDSTSLVDHKGEVFIHEICEYMKYRTMGDVAEFFLDKASLLEQPKKVSIIYEEKLMLEEKLVIIDEGILALMKYIDGVSTGKKGLLKNKNGTLKTESSFIKKILYGDPTMDSAGINNNAIFQALQDQYFDPTESLSNIDYNFERLGEIGYAIEALENDVEMVEQTKEDESKSLHELEEALSSSREDDGANIESIEANIEKTQDKISELEEETEIIQADIEAYEDERMLCIDAIITNGNRINEHVYGCLTASELAIQELERIIIIAQDCDPLIKSYEQNLDREKDGLDQAIYGNLREGLEEIKRYQVDNNGGYDFASMKETLIKKHEVLVSSFNSYNDGYQAITGLRYEDARNAYNAAHQALLTYETNGLNINYSTLVIDNTDSPDYLGGMKELLEEGITSLVIDPKTISDKEISGDMLPSIMDMLSDDDNGFSFTSQLTNMSVGGKASDLGGMFSSFGDFSLVALIGKGADEILERVLVQGYIDEHFYRFPVKEEEKEGRKPSVLTYEQEYLIYGKKSDKDNLVAVIGRLILIRTLLNFTSILGDKGKWSEAKSIASSLVGFTGLPILVAITQGVLMILLAFAAGLVDTCALLSGKELPILKKRVDLEYRDLLMLSRENIMRKAASIKEENGFSYKDYLTLLLCVTNQRKLSYRMMDLIQENINIRYGTDFNLQNCIFGYEAEARFKIKPLFSHLSFMQRYIHTDINKPLILQAECSY